MKKWLPCQRCLKLPGQGSPSMEVADRFHDLESLAASNLENMGTHHHQIEIVEETTMKDQNI